jgi:hypothetical protein
MRTTLTINDELLTRAKQLAAKRKSNVSAIVNEALRAALKKEDSQGNPEPFRLLTFGGDTPAPELSPSDMADMIAAEDLAPYGRE